MNDIELASKFLRGKPVNLGLFKLYPLTLDEIFDDVGFEEYNKYLSILCIDSDAIKDILGLEEDKNIEPFEYLYASSFHQEESKYIITNALHLFLKEEIIFKKEGYFQVGKNPESVIYQNNFNFIIDILKQQNCINSEKNKVKIENDAQKKFMEQLRKMKEKYKKYEKEQDIVDIMSGVCSKHPSINVFNVGKLTMWQLINAYKALNKIDEYYLSYKSIFAGGDPEKIKIKHWSEKLE